LLDSETVFTSLENSLAREDLAMRHHRALASCLTTIALVSFLLLTPVTA